MDEELRPPVKEKHPAIPSFERSHELQKLILNRAPKIRAGNDPSWCRARHPSPPFRDCPLCDQAHPPLPTVSVRKEKTHMPRVSENCHCERSPIPAFYAYRSVIAH